jgi:hypothetical protein
MTIPIEEQAAFEMGCKDFREGKAWVDNPYNAISKNYKSWNKGYQQAKKDKENDATEANN